MSREDQLAELLERWEEASTLGHTFTPEDLCQDCPELLPDFRKILGQLGPVNAVLVGNGVGNVPAEEFSADIDAGRYKPISFHKRGGLGMVFLAEDAEIGRSVALKCMQRLAATDSSSRRRFLVEAEITGRLEHPGIVPVYGLGQDAQGKPYYAMRFIHGETLGDAIEHFHRSTTIDPSERNVELRRLLRHFVAVCETMAYAHSRGVIHRDLKPANIMIGPYGETLVVDWGLAKQSADCAPGEHAMPSTGSGRFRADRSFAPPGFAGGGQGGGQGSEGIEDASVQGFTKGTPAFMSPEQANGFWDQVGPASDIYSLGSTLFVLLTGKGPYQGRTAREVIERVKQGDFTPPRKVNPAVPKTLDAICGKAMAFLQGDRYADARDMAKDIERWLADEPVTAYREPFVIRARRWLKRHRTLVSAGVAVLLVLVASVSIAAVLLENKNAQLAAEIVAKDRLNAQLKDEKAKLQASFAVTRENFDTADRSIVLFASAVNTRWPGGQHASEPVQDAVNTEARDYYRKFIAENGGREQLRMELAFAHLREATAEIGLRNETSALRLLDVARKRFVEFQIADPDDPHARYGLGCVELDAAFVHYNRLKVDNSRKSALNACELFAKLCGEKTPEGRWYNGLESPAFKLARAAMTLRDVERQIDSSWQESTALPLGKTTDDQSVLRFAQIAVNALTAEFEAHRDLPIEARGHFGLVLMCLGEELAIRNFKVESNAAFERSRTELAAMMKEKPAAYEIETMLCLVEFHLAFAAGVESNGKEVEPMLKIRKRLQELGNRDWGVDRFAVRYWSKLLAARCSSVLAQWALRRSDREGALRHFNDALKDIAEAAPASKQFNLATRVPLVMTASGMLAGMVSLGEFKPRKELTDWLRSEFAQMAPDLGHVPWFQRGRISVDALIGVNKLIQEPTEKDGLPLLEKAVRDMREYVKKHPDDGIAELLLDAAMMNHGFFRVFVADQIEDGLKELIEARARIVKYPADGPGAHIAKTIERGLALYIAYVNGHSADQLLRGNDPDRKKKARIHVDAALAEMAALKNLNQLEKETIKQLELLKKRVEP